jgi:hypothetical protein
MTTKSPSAVQPAPDGSIEKIAYACVAELPVRDPHDRDRLGYVLTLWLRHRRDPLDIAVGTASAHFLITEEEALRRIREQLALHGITA